ncbi:MAG: hypothetical protein H0V39_00470, partial [Nitrosomonas sp.]|nr:hypothetical protein [Nitrosomonas sp.]
MNDFFSMFKELFQAGGFVVLPLLICALFLWYGLGYRYWVMKQSKSMTVRDM